MTEEEQRIRSYLESQAAKLTPAAIVEKVEAAMGELDKAAAAVPAGRFGDRPAAEEWSANDVMAHVVSAGAHFGDRILAILDDRPSPDRPERASAETAPLRDAGKWRELLRRDRAALF